MFLSIRWKFFVVVAAVVIPMGVLILVTGSTMDEALVAEHDEKGVALARNLAAMAAEPMLLDNPVSLALLLADAKQSDDEVVYAFACDRRGSVVSHTFAGRFPADLLRVAGSRRNGAGKSAGFLTEKGPVADFAAPVMGGTVGTLHLGLSEKKVTEQVRASRNSLLLVTLIFLLLGLLLSHWMGTYLTRPLDTLVLAAEEVGRGNLGRRSRVTTRDEVGLLSAAFDRMCDDLQAHRHAREEAEEALRRAHDELEQRVKDRTAQLAAANRELDSFSYSVSHDLRAPLRGIDGFSAALAEDCSGRLDETGRDYLRRIRSGCARMGNLIDDLLNLSRLTQAELHREPVNLSAMALSIVDELRESSPERKVDVVIAPDVRVDADPMLLRAALENLLRNAWKFTRKCEAPRIELGCQVSDGRRVCFVRDNGVGFDMQYRDKLFGAFQRLHAAAEFEGSGVGLATVKRIVHRHGGLVWAEGEEGKGATFYFTLGEEA